MPRVIIITGNLNFQLIDSTNINFRRFSEKLDAPNLMQHVTGETHTRGHNLDEIITRDVSCIIQGMPTIVVQCLYDTNKVQKTIWIVLAAAYKTGITSLTVPKKHIFPVRWQNIGAVGKISSR